MSRELRLRATGERLVWWRCDADDGQYLSRESKIGDTMAWFAGATPIAFGCYDTDQWLGGNHIAGDIRPDPVDVKQAMLERALIGAGVVYVLDVEDDDGAFPSD